MPSFDEALGSGQIQSSSGGESNVAEVDTAAETKAGDGAEIDVDATGEADVDAVGETADAEPEATGASEVNPPRGFEDGVVVAKADAAVEAKAKCETAGDLLIDAEGELSSGCFCSKDLKFRVSAGGEVTSGCFCSENLEASTRVSTQKP